MIIKNVILHLLESFSSNVKYPIGKNFIVSNSGIGGKLIWVLKNWSGVQIEGEGLLHQLNMFKQITFGAIIHPWAALGQDQDSF